MSYTPLQNNDDDTNNVPLQDQNTGLETIAEDKRVILGVDDNKMLLDTLSRVLEHLGYDVILAATPEEALQIYRTDHSKIDAVVSDVLMPDMDGVELYLAMKKINPDLKTLFVTGNDDGKLEQLRKSGEGVHYLAKPYKVAEMQANLSNLLSSNPKPI